MTQRVHAFADDALGDHDAVGLVEALRAGRVSAVEAHDAAVARIEKVDGLLHGVAHRDFTRAREQACRVDAGEGTGFFAGVPSMAKDNTHVQGLPTQNGTHAYVAHRERADGDHARMSRAIGFDILGKTRMSEFGFNASAEFADGAPPVRNPWDTAFSSGGSSAGAAVLVASGALPVAHAVDGGGSIRIPAACTGLVGLKPTRGRVPTDRHLREMPVKIIADGILSRSVRDTAAFLRESERVYRRLTLPPVGDVRSAGRKRLRVALVVDSLQTPTDTETATAVRGAAKLLEELGHHVSEVDATDVVPATFPTDFLNYWALMAAGICVQGKRMLDPSFDRRKVDNLTAGLLRRSGRRAYQLPLSIARLQRAGRLSARIFADHDVVLSPTLGRTTPELGWTAPTLPYDTIIERLTQWATFTPLQNITGDPSLSLPLGTATNGLPIGVLLSAPQGHEARLLELGYELEDAQPFARIHA